MDHTGLSFGMLLVSTFRIMLERAGPPFLSERYSIVKVCENLGNIRITRHLCRPSTEEITHASEDAMPNCRARNELFIPQYYRSDFMDNIFNTVGFSVTSHLVGKSRRICNDLIFCDIVPDGKHNLLARHRSCDDAVKLVVRLPFLNKVSRNDNDAKSTVGKTVIDFSAQAVANSQLELVIPNGKPSSLKSLC